jgi:hypothetical protein
VHGRLSPNLRHLPKRHDRVDSRSSAMPSLSCVVALRRDALVGRLDRLPATCRCVVRASPPLASSHGELANGTYEWTSNRAHLTEDCALIAIRQTQVA